MAINKKILIGNRFQKSINEDVMPPKGGVNPVGGFTFDSTTITFDSLLRTFDEI